MGPGAELFFGVFVRHPLFTAVYLARAARGQSDSGFFPRLSNTEGSHPEGQKQHRIPSATYVCMRENDRHGDANGEHAETHDPALTDFLWPDIGELSLSDAHRNLPALFIIFPISLGSHPAIADISCFGESLFLTLARGETKGQTFTFFVFRFLHDPKGWALSYHALDPSRCVATLSREHQQSLTRCANVDRC
jgi:hypothetical protein